VKKIWLLGLILVLAISAIAYAYDPNTLVVTTVAGWDSFDPAWAYDTTSGGALFHIYESLVGYVGGSTSEFRPVLATEVPTIENGGIVIHEDGSGTVRFNIRQGVTFHNGDILTPEDVVYSIQRNLLADPTAGPNWMLLYQLLGIYVMTDIEDPAEGYAALTKAVHIAADDPNVVVFELPMMTPYFLSSISENCSWAYIVDKSWCIEQGAWDGTSNWTPWNDLAKEDMALYTVANGTGPFILDGTPDPVEGFSLARYDSYWDQENLPALKGVETVYIEEFSTRRLMLTDGDADIAYIPTQYIAQMVDTPGLRTIYNLPGGSNGGFLLNMDIVTQGNDRLGSGKLDGVGITPDFFTDVHVRRAFAYAFDYDTYIREVLNGEAVQCKSIIPPAVPFHNPDNPHFTYDLEKAAAEMKLAWGGEVLQKGFYMRLDYNAGNDNRKVGCEMLRDALMKIDPRYNIEVRAIPWANYLDDNRARRMTLFFIGWLWDYPDADNYVFPYMHSQGAYGGRGSFAVLGDVSTQIDSLITAGASTLDSEKREAAYYELQKVWFDEALCIMTDEQTGRTWQRTYVGGYQYNPTWSGVNYKVLYKSSDGTPAQPNKEELSGFDYKLMEW